MPVYYDQLNRAVEIVSAPTKIISLVPSQTELLFFLDLGAQIAGVTKFCIHPSDEMTAKPKIGGTKQLKLTAIHNLRPDLIIANKEENDQSQVEELIKHYPVWVSDVNSLQSALEMIRGVGSICNRSQLAELLVANISQLFEEIKEPLSMIPTAYFIWRKPYMVAGDNTFIDAMLQFCGFKNVFNASRYPIVNSEDLIAANPQLVLLSSEPYPFAEKHLEEFKDMLPNATVILVDGELFSWYGNRLLKAPAYFKSLIEHFL